jgi:nucleoid-associated protein YgaU
MQREVKIGLIIGVVILALVVVVWAKYTSTPKPVATDTGWPKMAAHQDAFATQAERVVEAAPATTAPGAGAPLEGAAPAAPGPAAPTAPGPAAPTAVEATPAPPMPPRIHVVQSGDTLWNLAEKYYGNGNKLNLILDANRTTVPRRDTLLKPGMKLVVPLETTAAAPPASSPAAAAPTTLNIPSGAEHQAVKHTLAKNDRLWDLAQKYYGDGSKWKRILDANKDVIKDERNLPVGKDIVIPLDK